MAHLQGLGRRNGPCEKPISSWGFFYRRRGTSAWTWMNGLSRTVPYGVCWRGLFDRHRRYWRRDHSVGDCYRTSGMQDAGGKYGCMTACCAFQCTVSRPGVFRWAACLAHGLTDKTFCCVCQEISSSLLCVVDFGHARIHTYVRRYVPYRTSICAWTRCIQVRASSMFCFLYLSWTPIGRRCCLVRMNGGGLKIAMVVLVRRACWIFDMPPFFLRTLYQTSRQPSFTISSPSDTRVGSTHLLPPFGFPYGSVCTCLVRTVRGRIHRPHPWPQLSHLSVADTRAMGG